MIGADRSRPLDWDYSELARHYEKRAPYDHGAVRAMLDATGVQPSQPVLDVGAGTGRLSSMLAREGLRVTAVEPNAAMREVGRGMTRDLPIAWIDATGEATTVAAGSQRLVTFGSSFNVVDRPRALAEAARVLEDDGVLALLWNHRDLDDPLQQLVESIIRRFVPDYGLGTRREDPREVLHASGLFGDVVASERRFVHCTRRDDFAAGFRAHATLIRQAGDALEPILQALEARLPDVFGVPFFTRVWYCRRR